MSQKSTFLKAFNNLLTDLMEDIELIFPGDKNIKTAKTTVETMRKANPSITIRMWLQHVQAKYGEKILEGDINYFLEKDYSEDVQSMANGNDINKLIEALREPIKNMGESNQETTLDYLQKLCKLADAYQNA
jgi:glutamyl-tRNA reductase